MATEHLIGQDEPMFVYSNGILRTYGVLTCTVVVVHNLLSKFATMLHVGSGDSYGGIKKMVDDILRNTQSSPANIKDVKVGLIGGRMYYKGSIDYKMYFQQAGRSPEAEEVFNKITTPYVLYSAYGYFRGKGVKKEMIETAILKGRATIVYNMDKADFEPSLKNNSEILNI